MMIIIYLFCGLVFAFNPVIQDLISNALYKNAEFVALPDDAKQLGIKISSVFVCLFFPVFLFMFLVQYTIAFIAVISGKA